MALEVYDAPIGPPRLGSDGAPGAPHAAGRPSWRRRCLNGLALIASVLVLGVLLVFILLRFFNPPISAVMLADELHGQRLRHRWVPLEDISPALIRAVIASEDGRFCSHWGVDWGSVRLAVDEALDGREPRGASTIPMQTVKNMFLWTERSYVRKVLEVPLAYLAVAILGRKRVLEIYLNIVQWGPGLFGAEAAARYHFGKDASQLTPHEAALMAASLPSPIIRKPGHPGPLTRKIAARVEHRVPEMAGRMRCVLPNS